jgi:hypothetical protein
MRDKVGKKGNAQAERDELNRSILHDLQAFLRIGGLPVDAKCRNIVRHACRQEFRDERVAIGVGMVCHRK